MDSDNLNTQTLSSQPPTQQPTMSYSEVYDLVSKKILVNKMSIENLKYQIQYFEAFKKAQDISIQEAQNKLKLVNQLNSIFEKQLSDFTTERQDECIVLYKQLYDLDTKPSKELSAASTVLKDIDNKMRIICTKIESLESTIPNEKLFTKFTIKNRVI